MSALHTGGALLERLFLSIDAPAAVAYDRLRFRRNIVDDLLIESPPAAFASHRFAAPSHHPQLDPALQAALWQALTDTLARVRPSPETPAPPSPARTRHALVPLSAREQEVLARIAIGDSNKLIARALGLSLHTVKRHVANILDKLDARSRCHAAAWWLARV